MMQDDVLDEVKITCEVVNISFQRLLQHIQIFLLVPASMTENIQDERYRTYKYVRK